MPVALFGIYFLFVCVRVVLNEDIHFTKQSLEYYLLIKSEVVTSVSTGNCEVSYYYTGGDGNKPPANGIELSCKHFPDVILDDTITFLTRQGFSGSASFGDHTLENEIKVTGKGVGGEFHRGRETADVGIYYLNGLWFLSLTHSLGFQPIRNPSAPLR